ncbi:hypothetical protein P1J78_12780 [Psychromarinibacter sp. C21-152]|uniref:Peptidase metallopeptidase domain-containing protein n=1 Tax=Psychromarinibacter sediminicola TaxID=3033385 RepID=A0AAE3T8U3_9RHOB|nr:matrixin family metalloprotease [Psychromarinibacter sediminicola]MDF0601612.1 hypothetical protein [Psychromarinibacter sediminicola]
MAKPDKHSAASGAAAKELELRKAEDAAEEAAKLLHVYARGAICETETRGFPTPDNRSPTELVVDATEGFIPLWAPGTTLRWRFNALSMTAFVNPEAAKSYVRTLMADAILAWGNAAPVRFKEAHDAWDFEIVVRAQEYCSPNGCVLASAFFPDGGQHELMIYPTMFQQSREEQVETMAHEIGHIFGLRHFFAQVSETAWPAEIFGTHERFSIMNYGEDSRLTDTDREDLIRLYHHVWSGNLTEINGTPIQQVHPYSHTRATPVNPMVAMVQPTVARRA